MMLLAKHSILFLVGGFAYQGVELLYRGHTHPSMFIVGGLCFVLIGLLNELLPQPMPLLMQMLISALLVTMVEFTAGMILNRWLCLGVWDYTNLPFNVLGQVSLPYSAAWFALSLPAIVLEDYLHHLFWGEPMPRYHFWNAPCERTRHKKES